MVARAAIKTVAWERLAAILHKVSLDIGNVLDWLDMRVNLDSSVLDLTPKPFINHSTLRN